MELSSTKIELIELLIKTDENLILQKVKEILENNFINENRSPSVSIYENLSVVTYNKKLQKAENDFLNRKVISHFDIKKKFNISNE